MNSKKIKELRKKIKMTQEEFGKAIGVSRKTIINYEKGEVIPETKRHILDSMVSGLEKNVNAASIMSNRSNRSPCSDTDKAEVESLKMLLSEKDKLLAEKDKLLAAKDETIALLKKMLDK